MFFRGARLARWFSVPILNVFLNFCASEMYCHSGLAPAAQPHQASVRETRVSRAVDIRRYISLVRSPNYRIHGRPFHEFSHSCTSRRSRSFVERRVVQTTCRSTKSRVRGRVLYVCLMSRGIPRRAMFAWCSWRAFASNASPAIVAVLPFRLVRVCSYMPASLRVYRPF